MKKFIPILAALLLSGCVSEPTAEPLKLATFGCHLVEAAKQKNITVAEMAKTARNWGIIGVDMWLGKDEPYVEDYLAAGLQPSVIIVFADFAKGPAYDRADAAIAFANRVHCNRIMAVPELLQPGESRQSVWPTVMRNLKSFVRKMNDAGLDVVLEDFDHDKAPIGSAEHLRRTFAEIPEAGLVLDTGNFDNWGDDVLAAMNEFLPRIRHVHMKDRDKDDPRRSVTTGTGREPMREIFDTVRGSGYGGWYTIECFGADDLYSVLYDSVKWFR